MAGLGFSGGRLLLFVVVVCLIACVVCEARGGRGGRSGGRSGGGRSRARYGGRSHSGGYHGSGGGGGGRASGLTLVITILGVFGGIIVLVGVMTFIKAFCCDETPSSESANLNRSGDATLSNQTSSSTAARTANGLSENYSTFSGNDQKTSDNDDSTRNGDEPPSYDSVVSQNRSGLPYSSNPCPSGGFTKGFKSPPAAGYSGDSSDLPYSANPTETSYSFSRASAPTL